MRKGDLKIMEQIAVQKGNSKYLHLTFSSMRCKTAVVIFLEIIT